MSGYLWKYYLEDDVDSFRHVLENTAHIARPGTQKGVAGWQGGSLGATVNSSPAGSYGPSPMLNAKGRKTTAQIPIPLTRSDINSRDGVGLTILHHAASSSSENAIGFAQALLEHPLTDLYIQDAENGWTALHTIITPGG
jgi:inhibitor of Bruton tyrosine kinase